MEGIVYERLKGYIKRRKGLYLALLSQLKDMGDAEKIYIAIIMELDALLDYAEIQENAEIEQMAKEGK